MDESDKQIIESNDSDSSIKPTLCNILDEAMSQSMFPLSPAYDLDSEPMFPSEQDVTAAEKSNSNGEEVKDNKSMAHIKRKLSDGQEQNTAKMQKLEQVCIKKINQTLDDEVSRIISRTTEQTTSKMLTPKKVSKRSSSTETPKTPKTKTPKTPRSRSASVDITKQKTPRRTNKAKTMENLSEEIQIVSSDSSNSRPSVEFVKEIPAPMKPCEPIAEEVPSYLNYSQDFHLHLSSSPEERNDDKQPKPNASSDPVIAKHREEVINPGKVVQTRSEGYNYSDQSSNLSQPMRPMDYGKATDQESTDSVCSISMESPENIPNVASKLISKLSNGNSSTPTEQADSKNGVISISDSDSTPDLLKLNNKLKRGIESFKTSNTTTPSTISPLQNGHSIPLNMNTPQIPTFDIHVSHNEDGEFLSLYVVRTDNDVGSDMYKEYQRFSKRFTIDPYLGDVSTNNSPSSVTSTGMINLPNRISFASTTSSTSSNRTSDGNFVVPQPPRKSISHPESLTVKGCEALIKKLRDIVSHMSHDETNRSNVDEKVSIGIQASPNAHSNSNGNASPEEVSKCDKATPKSSLKKTRVRGRRPLGSKTKRALLPTQDEEPEYMHGMNSPEMVPVLSENGIASPEKDDKPLSSLIGTPKSVTKLKQKRRPTSPRPATPVDKVKQEYPGYPPDTVVLAKWVDKRYYSGKVLEITEPNKYLIKFDDGQTKALLDDFIIFGDNKVLPLQGQSVYAMVDEEQNYEPGLVMEIDENSSGTITYRCTTDGEASVSVTATELYLTEDQARSIKESVPARSPSTPTTPRRRGLRELDLDNIIQGPRSARTRDKGSSSSKKRVASPKSPKASTSGLKPSKGTPTLRGRRRPASESSSLSESSNPAPAQTARLDHVPGLEPELQRTPRKIDGVKAGPLHLKGLTKQNVGKKNSKLAKFPQDPATISQLGPIPGEGSQLFAGLRFLLTCADAPAQTHRDEKETRHYSSEEDGETTTSMVGTDTEDLEFSSIPFNKERLKEQLEAGGGIVYSHFEDLDKSEYPSLRLIAPRPCLTAKYIQCLAAGVRAVTHGWVAASCREGVLADMDAYVLPPGWSIRHQRFATWDPPLGKRNTKFFKDKIILLCGDQDTFVKYWERICTLAGATTRVVNEEDLNVTGAIVCVTDWDCPHEVQNKANQDNIPLVSTTWVVQCLIEAQVIPPTSHDKFSFMYTEPE